MAILLISLKKDSSEGLGLRIGVYISAVGLDILSSKKAELGGCFLDEVKKFNESCKVNLFFPDFEDCC